MQSNIREDEEIIIDLEAKILELNPSVSAIQAKIKQFELKMAVKPVDNQELRNLVRGVGVVG